MSVTLSQLKQSLQSQKSIIELLIERGHDKPENHSRLAEIEAQFKVFEMMGNKKTEELR